MASPYVHSTHLSNTHSFSKTYTPSITLLTGVGVQGDCHSGTKNQKSSQSTTDSSTPNLRQVHLIPYELFTELRAQNFVIQPGELGENITTTGIDLLGLAKGSYLYFGSGDDVPIVQVTGLRRPGPGIEKHKEGLLDKVLLRDGAGRTICKAGIMGVVVKGGKVNTGDMIRVVEPQGRKVGLEPV
ncbi:PK beta-barrel-protein domain-containing protein-like protein [Lindgomyces ingoldianus]|uniref:PK beta-barrel-protein domain-containing protein-like protein n=1 Tax=Lindgomyces ingoldianus TaxID=673940 RepID=A0ACB6R705_9PLEO|nr:PK beta-barrel-protein domain-containing protein-like protein [Lindgomyces ingoldianus]KAF2474857.1 PK beta-barrel-protein domain-containing protein-like protein [Lindgomyces ingoldianus]